MFDSENPSLNDLRRHLWDCAYPGFFFRCCLWIGGWFAGREFREMLRMSPEVKPYFLRQVGIIDAMTPAERATPAIISLHREQRIARGSGTHPGEVRELVAWYYRMLRESGEVNLRKQTR